MNLYQGQQHPQSRTRGALPHPLNAKRKTKPLKSLTPLIPSGEGLKRGPGPAIFLFLPHPRELSHYFSVRTSAIICADALNATPNSALTLNSSKRKYYMNRHCHKTAMAMARVWGQEVFWIVAKLLLAMWTVSGQLVSQHLFSTLKLSSLSWISKT